MKTLTLGTRALLGLAALTASQFAWARATNFRGFDEWLVLSLLSRGLVSAPYAHRPLAQAFALPAWWLAPDRLEPILVLHALYMGAAGFLVFLTVRRVWPEATSLAWLAAAFTLVWSPTDPTRLCSVQMVPYSGETLAVVAAHWLFVRSWSRGSLALLAGAVLSGGIAVLAHEATLLPLALAPVWIFLARDQADGPRGRRPRWTGAWASVIALGAAWFLSGLLAGGDALRYQASHLGGRATIGTTLTNLGARLGEHAGPLFANAVSLRDLPAAVIASSVFLAGLLAVAGREDGTPPPRACAQAAAVGVAWTVLAHLPFAVSTAIHGPSRTQYFSAPGLGLALAALLCALRAAAPRRLGQAATLVLSTWIVAQATTRTVGFQRYWDEQGAFASQAGTLAELLRLAPSIEPGTLVVLLGQGSTWKLELAFRHAVSYVYGEQAIGHAPAALPFLYRTRFEADGIVDEPDHVIRGPWHEPVRRFGYDQLIVVRTAPQGRLTLLEAWPAELPPLPPGARYDPRARIRSGPLPQRAALVLGKS